MTILFFLAFVINELIHIALGFFQSHGDFVTSSKQILLRTVLYGVGVYIIIANKLSIYNVIIFQILLLLIFFVVAIKSIPKFEIAQIEFLFSIDNEQSLQSPYKKGDLLGCKQLRYSTFIQWGKTFLIATKQGILVRKLFPVENENQFECRAEDLSTYPSFNIDRTEIISLSIVLGVVRME